MYLFFGHNSEAEITKQYLMNSIPANGRTYTDISSKIFGLMFVTCSELQSN